MLAPKVEKKTSQGKLYHAREKYVRESQSYEWFFEECKCDLLPTIKMLVRILVAKVENIQRLEQILRTTPIRHEEAGWNCVFWVREALEKLKADKEALGTSVVEWATVRDTAMKYCQDKIDQHRFDSFGGFGGFDEEKIPTYDLIEEVETIL